MEAKAVCTAPVVETFAVNREVRFESYLGSQIEKNEDIRDGRKHFARRPAQKQGVEWPRAPHYVPSGTRLTAGFAKSSYQRTRRKFHRLRVVFRGAPLRSRGVTLFDLRSEFFYCCISAGNFTNLSTVQSYLCGDRATDNSLIYTAKRSRD